MYKVYFEKIVFYSNYKIINKYAKLILFHGLGCDALDFKGIFKNNFNKIQILIPIIPGHSNSLIYNKIDPLYDFAKQIYLFIKKKKINDFSIYAHSMGNIISTLLLKYFLKRKCSLLINNEGNICSSDAGIITRKTLSYSEHYFANYGFKNLIKKCKMSKVTSIRIWSDSLKKISATNFYKYSRSVVYWSDKNILLKWINYFFKKKVYIYGDKSKNIDVLNKIKGHKTICLKHTGHFAHLEKKAIISRLILTELKKRKT